MICPRGRPRPSLRWRHGVLRRRRDHPALLEETIGANFERTVAAYPDREALVEVATGRRWTWAELDRDVDALARGLIAAGLAKGDRVGIWAPNCAEWTLVQYATAKVGVILVNVNPSYRTHELAYALNQSGRAAAAVGAAFKTSDYRAMVEEVAGECPALERVVYLDTDDWAALVAEGEALPAGALAERMPRRSRPATRSTSSTPPAPPAAPRARR